MKFTDYEASYITPQKTLIKKLNEILKWLRGTEKTFLYIHKIRFVTTPAQYFLLISSIKEDFKEYKTTDLHDIENAVLISANLYLNQSTGLKVKYNGTYYSFEGLNHEEIYSDIVEVL